MTGDSRIGYCIFNSQRHPNLARVKESFTSIAVNPAGNPNIGSGKLDGNGIPPDFFSDINVRKAFLHAFDRKTYAEDVFNGPVITPTSPNGKDLP